MQHVFARCFIEGAASFLHGRFRIFQIADLNEMTRFFDVRPGRCFIATIVFRFLCRLPDAFLRRLYISQNLNLQ